MRTSAQPLEGNQVKLTVEVDEEEIRQVEDDTLRRLTREARVPGFRPGKVPRRLLAARLGPKVIREEVLRDMLPRFYADAVEESELDVITAPEIDVTTGQETGPIAFDAVVEVRPRVAILGYEGLVVKLASPVPSPEEVSAQIDRMREQFAELTEVDRPAREADVLLLDLRFTREGEADDDERPDFSYEVGSGRLLDGLDEQLVGKKIGDIFELDAADAEGVPVHARVFVKQVREKLLPEADDAFAADASEFDTIAELRDDLVTRMTEVRRLQANVALRERAIEALVELVEDEPPPVLVGEETERLINEMVHQLSHQKATLDQYLEATGKTPDELLAEVQAQAKQQVKADLALRALAEAEKIEVDESEVDDEIVRIAEQQKLPPARVRSVLEQDGRIAGLRSQLRTTKALTWLVERVDIVDDEGNPMDRSALRLGSEPGLGSVESSQAENADTPDGRAAVASDDGTEESASAVPGEA